jgi:hypothetical protein
MSRVRRSARHSKDDTEKRETGHAPAGTRSPALPAVELDAPDYGLSLGTRRFDDVDVRRP